MTSGSAAADSARDRVPAPACPHFPRCGGCRTLTTPYSRQLTEKKQLLEKLFASIDVPIPDVLPSPEENYYRHKVQLPFGFKRHGRGGIVTLGCYANDSHEVVDQHACLVQDRDLSLAAWAVRDWAQTSRLGVYDERRHDGFLRHVLLRKGAATGEILVGLVTNGQRPPGSRNLAESLLERTTRALSGGKTTVVGIVQNVNTRSTNVVLGEQEFVWWGRPFLFEKTGDYRFALGLQTFFQVNPFQTPRLYDEVLKWIEHRPRVLDVYCGVGSISLWVAKKSAVVTGVEENAASVATAKKAAEKNGVRNVRYRKGDAEIVYGDLTGGNYDTVIFDPPRKGLDPGMVHVLLTASVKRVIYVSCNPETLARDVKALLPAWSLVSLQGVDMFPHTEHVEAMAVLDRR
jgi:23S rRNA (uracil1939-C5)-methyltransferase